jgi:hypothetical protein
MTDATTEFFTELGERRHEPALERMTGTVRFDLREDGGTTRWLVAIELLRRLPVSASKA